MTQEKISPQKSGWIYLFILIIVLFLSIAGFIRGIIALNDDESYGLALLIISIIVFIIDLILMAGFFTLEPNEAAVLILFGKYIGTEKNDGFKWTNPFYKRNKISLRARNFNSEKLKVNDKKGNPIEISCVVVWRVKETALAAFNVDNYSEFVHVQSESAVRHVATKYAYDDSEGEEISLRASIDIVSEDLLREIQERVNPTGVTIEEARINHLAYAPEIAHAMLQRQQAEAVIAARTKIVEGAVSMVEMALERLKVQGVVDLDEERKANMVSNLMVVLCSDRAAQPIVNTGSLY